MAQDYATFKTYMLTYAWRENDTVFSNNFDVLVQQSNDELDKLTKDWQRRQKTIAIAPETADFNLTTGVTDYLGIIALINNLDNTGGVMRQRPLSDIYGLRAKNPSVSLLPNYGVDRDDGTLYLRLVGEFSASDPGDMTLIYKIAIPDYAVDDASWIEDEYLNLYVYTVLKHCAMFLREDDRVEMYSKLQGEAFEQADTDDKHQLQFAGSPLTVSAPRPVP